MPVPDSTSRSLTQNDHTILNVDDDGSKEAELAWQFVQLLDAAQRCYDAAEDYNHSGAISYLTAIHDQLVEFGTEFLKYDIHIQVEEGSDV